MSEPSTKSGCFGFLLGMRAGEKTEKKGVEGPWPYRRKKFLLSRAEFSFFRALQRAVGERMVVCPKVNLNDLFYLEKGTQGRMAWLNRINRKHADFVVCNADTMRPIVVVELDDASHEGSATKARDEVKDRACQAAELPLVRVKAERAYQVEAVRAAVLGSGAGDASRPG